ncbi:hypothetical protein Pelo_17355 [Pelomyxa schiedti]|nr:hypothetical protein Pelo_17355 [Pelomyxa schiedti]
MRKPFFTPKKPKHNKYKYNNPLQSQPFDIIYSPYAGSAGTSGAAFHKRDYPFEPCTSSDQTLEWESRGRLPVEHSLLSDGDPFAVNTSLAFETRDVSLYQRRTSNLEEY